MKWESYKSNPVEIQERLNPNRRMQVEQNRIYFGKLVSYIRWFCLQEVAFRDEEEHAVRSVCRGNFRELLELEFELHPEFLAQKKSIMEQYSIYTDYLSKTVYEEFISIMAGEIRKIIAREIAQTKFYTLVLDEAKDVSGYEQLCLCVRYCSGSVPAERLMGLIRLSEGLFDACAIVHEAKVLIQLLSGFGCSLVGLAADGASVMSGKLAGVQAPLKEEHPWLIYVHCAAHRLNLVLVKALKNLCPAMINIVDKLHSQFNSAKTNDSFEAEQKTLKIRVLKIP